MQVDVELGYRIHEELTRLGLETPLVKRPLDPTANQKYIDVKTQIELMLNTIGLDLTDDSLKETPSRVAKMYCSEIFRGLDYMNFPKATAVKNKMGYNELVIVRGIEIKSMCEHHLMPFIGKATIAYIPKERVLGLSKFNRVAEFFARRPQIQERLTEQIAAALRYILETDDVAVIIEAKHFCVVMRGSEDNGSDTITSKMTGKFFEVPALRQELTALIKR